MSKDIYDVVIVGAGASGLTAALVLAKKNIKTLLLEKNAKIGRKILSTGAGKCNISNKDISDDFYHSDSRGALKSLFEEFPPKKILGFLEENLFLLPLEKESGKIYPFSRKAENVAFLFESALEKSSVSLMKGMEVFSVKKESEFFVLEAGSSFLKEKPLQKKVFRAKKLILAAGGPSYPAIGGSFKGFSLAESLGHSINKVLPIITPMEVKTPSFLDISGVRLEAEIFCEFTENKKKFFGEVLFTDYGLSGPAVLDISFYAAKYGGIVKVFLDLLPDFSAKKVESELLRLASKKRNIFISLLSFFDMKLAFFIVKGLSLNKNLPLEKENIPKVVRFIKEMPLFGFKFKGFDCAMGKTGGVPFKELQKNLMSKKAKDLYLTGEMIDCAGKSGGYNLHFAFTSAIAAAENISKTL